MLKHSQYIYCRRRKFRTNSVGVSSLTLITSAEISYYSSVCGLFYKLESHSQKAIEFRDTKYSDVLYVIR